MDKAVVELCVRWADAMKVGKSETGKAGEHYYAAALTAAREGERLHPGVALPQNTTWNDMAKLAEDAMAKLAEDATPRKESAPAPDTQPEKASTVDQGAETALPERAGPFTVFGPDGESFGDDNDFEACKEVAAELGAGSVVRDRDGALLYPLPEPEAAPVQVKETIKERLARRKAELAAAQQAASKPEPEPVVREFTITHDAVEGTVLHGTAKGDNELIRPLGTWRYFRGPGKPGRWYLPQSAEFRSQDAKIEKTVSLLAESGIVVKVEIDNIDPATGNELPVKLTSAERKALAAAERARQAEQSAAAKVAAEAARKAAAPEVTMPGLELFAAAAALAQPAPVAVPATAAAAAPVKAATTRARRSTTRKPSLDLEGLAATPGALWWRLSVKDGDSAKTAATDVRRALRGVADAHAVDGEEDVKIEVRLHKGSRTLLIGAVLPERDTVTVDRKLVEVQVPGVASLMVPSVGTLVASHSDF